MIEKPILTIEEESQPISSHIELVQHGEIIIQTLKCSHLLKKEKRTHIHITNEY